MISMPNPLHAAVVHFPIVLILLGAVAAIVAVFTQRWSLPLVAALLLCLGAFGTIVGVMTGKDEGRLVGSAGPIEQVLDEHEEWAERTRAFASIAAVVAVVAALTLRHVGISRTLATGTAGIALVASWCVFQTGHYGGQLVYRHGAGVNASSAIVTANGAAETKRTHVDDD
jgi:uncharacterized membrane protein